MTSEAFMAVRQQEIVALNLTVEEFTHTPTGAKHFHLATDSSENAFMVAFRTVPGDSKGAAHILEHTVLCGSERFPVRDPFFMMLRRSLNTYMNAFTASDYTAYPFASQNRKDYFNLMAVYLDAVFFPGLNPLDFAQEGCRLEFEKSTDPASELVYRGIVYNEMKGSTSSPVTRLYDAVREQLYPTSTYHYNSGGDPEVIPALTYDELIAFYKTHYHPGNAVFMTFGNISARENQATISRLSLDRFDGALAEQIVVNPEVRYQSPVRAELTYPVDEDDQATKTHIVFGWLLGRNTDLEMLLKCQLLSDVLLDTSASPLRKALEKTEFASAPSPLCGFQQEQMEMSFMCGVEGSDPAHADAVEALILSVLEQVAEEGIPMARLEAVLHQLELSQREIGGDGMPYGLQIIFSCISAAIHRGDPIGLLDLEATLARLQQDITDPDFIKSLTRELLLDNPHRVRVVMKPDRDLGAGLIKAEKARLAGLKAQMDEAERSRVIDLARALETRQNETEDLEVLPRVGRQDIPKHKDFYNIPPLGQGSVPLTACAAGTNGIVYYQIVTDLPALSEGQIDLLPLYSSLVTEVGCGQRDYLQTQQLQHSVSGGISAFSSVQALPDDYDACQATHTFSSMTLNRKAAPMASLLRETALEADFEEYDRVRELIRLLKLRRMSSIAGNGHHYAMLAASAPLRPVAAFSNRLSGIPGILALKRLDESLDDRDQVIRLAGLLQALQQALTAATSRCLIIADSAFLPELTEIVSRAWQETDNPQADTHLALPALTQPGVNPAQAFVTTTQVNFCASAFATVPECHADAVPLWLLGELLRNNFLHSELREKGGAYGGGASYDRSNGIFRFYSYRDPNISDTFEVFERAVDWILAAKVGDEMLEEAVLGVVSGIDSPASPAGEIRQAYRHALSGRGAAHRTMVRNRVLEVRVSDIKCVAERYLTLAGSKALVTSENRLKEIDREFEVTRIAAA